MSNPWEVYNFSAIFNDPRMWSKYEYSRNVGKWNDAGEWEGNVVTGTFKGIIDTASSADIEMLPQGDKINDAINIVSEIELFMSEKNHLADIIEYKGDKYKVAKEKELNSNLYYYIAVRQDEDEK